VVRAALHCHAISLTSYAFSAPFLFFATVAMDVACLRPSAQALGTANTGGSGSSRYGSSSSSSSVDIFPSAKFSSQQSDKLWKLLTALYGKGGYSHTFGSLDPVQVTQMAPHLATIYVSGWQCSSTASSTNEPGPDVADYPVRVLCCALLPLKKQYFVFWARIRLILFLLFLLR